MKSKFLFIVSILIVLLSNCVVVSFYPFYTENDIITDHRIIGTWMSTGRSTQFNASNPNLWEISFPDTLEADKDGMNLNYNNKNTYLLKTYSKETPEAWAKFWLHIIELNGQLYADIFPTDWEFNNDMLNAHRLSVHSIAKIGIGEKICFNWIDPEWLGDLFDQKKIRIHHEDNGWNILLTAKPGELQKFLIKYGNDEQAYKDGIFQELERIN